MGRLGGTRGNVTPDLTPPLTVPAPGSPRGSIREGMDIRGVSSGVGMCSPSVNNRSHHFSPGGICINGMVGTMGVTTIIGS